MADTLTHREPVRLSSGSGPILVTAEDDRFFISADKAVKACRDAVREQEKYAHFRETLLVPIREWCEARSATVKGCYLGLPGPTDILPAYIVPAAPPYRKEITREANELADVLHESGWRVVFTQLPSGSKDELAGLFDADQTFQVYGA